MTQITGDDHPTYEDSVKESLKEIAEKTMNKYSNTLQKLSDKPLDRFDMEDRIMEISSVIEDLDTLLYMIGDAPEPASEDQIMNTIIGIQEIYKSRHERLTNTFASLIKQGTIK